MIRDFNNILDRRLNPKQPAQGTTDSSASLRRLRLVTKDRISQPSSNNRSIQQSPGMHEAPHSHRDLNRSALYNELQQLQQGRDSISNIAITEKIVNGGKIRRNVNASPLTERGTENKNNHLIRKSVGSDTLQYKEIFIVPKEKALRGLEEKERSFYEPSPTKPTSNGTDKLTETETEGLPTDRSNSLSKYFKLRLKHTRSSSQVNLSMRQPTESKGYSHRNSVENSVDIFAAESSPREANIEDGNKKIENNVKEEPSIDFSLVSKERVLFELQIKVNHYIHSFLS